MTFQYLDDLRSAYDNDAVNRSEWDDLQWRPAVIDSWLAGLRPSPRLLELGPGTGQLAAYVQSRGATVLAIDLSPRNVEHCQRRGVTAFEGDLRRLDRQRKLGRFDGIYSINALLHVPRSEHAGVIAGARELLCPGGSLLLVNWGGIEREGVHEEDRCDPPRFFSFYDDARFFSLEFEGFRVEHRETLEQYRANGLYPQVLVLRSL